MRFSIRYQILLPLFLLILGVVGIGAWSAWSSAARAKAQIQEQMDAVADTVRNVTFPRNRQSLRLMKSLSGVDFLLCDPKLDPLRDDRGRPLGTLDALPEDLPAHSEEQGLGMPVRVGDDVFFCRAVHLGPDLSSGLVLFQFYPEERYRDAVWQAIRPGLVLGFVGGLASVVLTIAVSQRLTRRIQQLERRTRLIAAGDFSPMPVPNRNDELRDLAGSVNEMAQQLSRYQETMQVTERLRLLGQVSGGLAHQLRNGVAGARLAVQLHARDCADAADAETLQVALRQLSLVELHLKRFLDLGKASELRKAPCDVVAILNDILTLLAPQARHAHTNLGWKNGDIPIGTGAYVGAAEHLNHMFLNILTNALEAVGGGGTVQVSLEATPSHLIAEIADTGPGPDPALADRLFEPFATGKPEGVGLGLAVAQQVALAHGGNIAWRREEGRTVFRVELVV